jgi:hypothetical protein
LVPGFALAEVAGLPLAEAAGFALADEGGVAVVVSTGGVVGTAEATDEAADEAIVEAVGAAMSVLAEVTGLLGVTGSGSFLSPPQATKKPTAAVTAKGAKTRSLLFCMSFSVGAAMGSDNFRFQPLWAANSRGAAEKTVAPRAWLAPRAEMRAVVTSRFRLAQQKSYPPSLCQGVPSPPSVSRRGHHGGDLHQ